MAIDSHRIKGELAIELDADNVSVSDFHTALDAFLSIVRELTKQINNKSKKDGWLLSVQEGSQVVCLRPDNVRLPAAIAGEIVSSLLDGMEALENEANRPQYFTETALESARTLSRLVKKDDGIPIRLLSRNRARPVTKSVFKNISEILDWDYEDIGTVEGILEVVSAHNGYEFRIYEPIWLKSIKCTFSEELLSNALNAFKKRVEVHGTIKYTKEGIPVSARVEKINKLPESSDLPSWRDVQGILSAS